MLPTDLIHRWSAGPPPWRWTSVGRGLELVSMPPSGRAGPAGGKPPGCRHSRWSDFCVEKDSAWRVNPVPQPKAFRWCTVLRRTGVWRFEKAETGPTKAGEVVAQGGARAKPWEAGPSRERPPQRGRQDHPSASRGAIGSRRSSRPVGAETPFGTLSRGGALAPPRALTSPAHSGPASCFFGTKMAKLQCGGTTTLSAILRMRLRNPPH